MAKNYINDNNRWKQKGANMAEKAYGSSFNLFSGVSNLVSNASDAIGNLFSGGSSNDPQPPASSSDSGGGTGGGKPFMFPGIQAAMQQMRANMQNNQMGMQNQGDGGEVTVRGRIINDQFRPHFKGGFGPGMNYTTSESKQYKKQKIKEPKPKVTVEKRKLKKEFKDQTSAWLPNDAYKIKRKKVTQKRADRMTSRKSGNWRQLVYGIDVNKMKKIPNTLQNQKYTNSLKSLDGASINLKNLGSNLKEIIKGDPDVKKARIASRERNIKLKQEEKTKRSAIKQGEKTKRVEARNK